MRANLRFCLAVIVSILIASLCDAASVFTSPSSPMMNVPFLATPSGITSGTTLYLSTSSTCTTTGTPASICTLAVTGTATYNTTTCTFTVTYKSLSLDVMNDEIPALYWCGSSQGTTNFGTLQLSTITPTPLYVYYNIPTTLTMNDATPVSSTIGFYGTSDCSGIIGSTTNLTSTRQAALTISNGNVAYICATVPYYGGNVSIAAYNVVYASAKYNLNSPTSGLRYDTVTMNPNSVLQKYSLSESSNCVPLSQTAQAPTGSVNSLYITAARGEYYFCGVTAPTTGTGVFIPAEEKFTVLAYGIMPTVMYAGMETAMTLTQDAVQTGVTFQNGLFKDESCSTAIINWSTTLDWTVANAGTYYACIRVQGSTAATMADVITVLNKPDVSTSSPLIFGLGATTTITRNGVTGIITTGVSSTGSCTFLASGNTTSSGSTASFIIPTEAASELFVCISTPDYEEDSGYLYALPAVSVSKYALTYSPIFQDSTVGITLDTSVTLTSGSTIVVVPESDGCDASSPLNKFTTSTSTTSISVKFTDAGSYIMCIKDASSYYSGFGLNQVRTLAAYNTSATLSPSGAIVSIPAAITISGIPPSTTTYYTVSTTCSGTQLFAATADSDGSAVSTVTYASAAELTVCVGYYGEDSGSATGPTMTASGTLPITAAKVYPTAAVGGYDNQLNIMVPDSQLLAGASAYVVSGSQATCTTTIPAGTEVTLTVGTDSDVMPYFTFSPSTTDVGTTYTVCLIVDATYATSAGDVVVVGSMTMTTTPTYGVQELPLSAVFSGSYLSLAEPDVYVVVSTSASCSDITDETVYASGTITYSTGVASTFIVPTAITELQFCLGNSANLISSTVGYVYGGETPAYEYTALSRYAVINQANDIQSWPLVDNAIVYLTPCTTTTCLTSAGTAACTSGTRYYTSSSLTLQGASAGTYYLCQQSPTTTTAITGANETVTVTSAWSMSTDEDPIRQYKPFTVTLSGTSIPTGGVWTLVVQPATTACGSTATTSQSFTISSATTSITIEDIEPITAVVFCLKPTDYESYQVMTGTVYHYMTPAVLIGDASNVITSGYYASSTVTKIARTAACSDMMSLATGSITNYQSTLYVTSCGTNANDANGYYCESRDGGVTWSNKGVMPILRSTSCTDGEAATITEQTVKPGVAISDSETGIDTTILQTPFLSTSSTCSSTAVTNAQLAKGYSPAYNEAALFYVCAYVISYPTYVFTTTSATLTVTNWAITPSSALTRYSSTVGVQPSTSMTLNYVTPSTNTFFSQSSSCSSSVSSASAFHTALTATYKTISVRGLVYVCTTNTIGGASLAVAAFLSVAPPTVSASAPAIVIGADYTATLVVEAFGSNSALYSMQGSDSGYTYYDYFVSDDRDVFLSSSQTCSAALTQSASVDTSNEVVISTTGLSSDLTSVYLCTGTPAGNGVAKVVKVSSSSVYPTTFYTGIKSDIYMPLNPSTTFQLATGSDSCSDVTTLPSFTSDSLGYSTLVLYYSSGEPAAVGSYTVCYDADGLGSLTALATIGVISQVHYSVKGYNYVVNVPGVMELLYDLNTDVLYSGFSTTRDCSNIVTSYGSWSSITSTSIEVSPTTAISNLYLCASISYNDTISSLPGYPRAIEFTTSSITPPDSGYDTCNKFTVSDCAAPGSYQPPNQGVLAVIYGNCCNASDRANLIGSSLMSSNKCSLSFSSTLVALYPSGTEFTMCVWDTIDTSYCTTLGTVPITTDCTYYNKNKKKGLSTGWLIFIIIASIIAGLLLLALIAYLIWICCYRDAKAEEKKLIALRQMEGSEYAYPTDYLEEYMDAENQNRNPLLYYSAVAPQSEYSVSEYSDATAIKEAPASRAAPLAASATCAAPIAAFEEHVEEQAEEEPEAIDRGDEMTEEAMEEVPTHVAMVQRIEDDGRDQLALEEAKERYIMCLHFKEQLERQRLKEKEAEVELGYEDDIPIVPSTGYSRRRDRGVSDDDHQLEYIEETPEKVSYPPEEARTPQVHTDGEHDMHQSINREVPLSGHLSSRTYSPTAVSPDFSEIPAGSQSPPPATSSRGMVEPAHRPNVHEVDSYLAPNPMPLPYADEEEAAYVGSPAERSPSFQRGPSDHLVSHVPLAVFDPATRDDDDDSDYDAMSYTTTQRYHDENRFLCEEEESRRQRLCNWEEEERAQLAQLELGEYIKVARRPPSSDDEESDGTEDLYGTYDPLGTRDTHAHRNSYQ